MIKNGENLAFILFYYVLLAELLYPMLLFEKKNFKNKSPNQKMKIILNILRFIYHWNDSSFIYVNFD